MLAIKLFTVATALVVSASSFADSTCEANAKTRDDALRCSKIDTDKMLSDSEKLYSSLRKLATGSKRIELDKNHEIWGEKIKSDCELIAHSFNNWGGDYTPDTDFQVSACRAKVAAQELNFYEWLACPDDMETSKTPKCASIKKALESNQ